MTRSMIRRRIVDDLGGGLHRMHVADTRPLSRAAEEFVDLHESQG
jgi:hypothetical protein